MTSFWHDFHEIFIVKRRFVTSAHPKIVDNMLFPAYFLLDYNPNYKKIIIKASDLVSEQYKFNKNETISRNQLVKLTTNFRYEPDYTACTYIRALIDIIVPLLSRVRQSPISR